MTDDNLLTDILSVSSNGSDDERSYPPKTCLVMLIQIIMSMNMLST